MKKLSNYLLLMGSQKELDIFFSDLKGEENVVLLSKDCLFSNRLMNLFFRFSFSHRVNSTIPVFWKPLFYRKIYKRFNIAWSSNLTVIIDPEWYDEGFLKYLKRKVNGIRLCLIFYDTVNLSLSNITSFSITGIKNEFDYVLVYNPTDVKKYGFHKCSNYLSKFEIEQTSDCVVDLSFIGRAKDRLDLIRSIYKHIGNKCNCEFYVSGYGKERKNDGIVYLDKEFTYEEYLKKELSSNCILEVLKGDTEGATLRCWEAVYYNKKLLTNWKGIFDFEYYDARFMRYFETPDDIDPEFVNERLDVDYNYRGDNSPVCLIKLLDSFEFKPDNRLR